MNNHIRFYKKASSYFWATAGVTVIGALAAVFALSGEGPSAQKQTLEQPAVVNHAGGLDSPPKVREEERNRRQLDVVIPASSKPIKSFNFYGNNDRETPMKVAEDPGPFIKKAQAGDGAAARLVLSAIMACFPLNGKSAQPPVVREDGVPPPIWEECNKLDPQLARNRLGILMPAINAGSPEAKFQYAITADDIFMNDRYSLDMQSLYTSDKVHRVVEKYAIEAANAGLEEAFAFLAKSYSRGEFGLRDPITAFAYASALDSVNPGGMGAYMSNEYGKSLTPQQRADALVRAATIVATCCQSP